MTADTQPTEIGLTNMGYWPTDASWLMADCGCSPAGALWRSERTEGWQLFVFLFGIKDSQCVYIECVCGGGGGTVGGFGALGSVTALFKSKLGV